MAFRKFRKLKGGVVGNCWSFKLLKIDVCLVDSTKKSIEDRKGFKIRERRMKMTIEKRVKVQATQ